MKAFGVVSPLSALAIVWAIFPERYLADGYLISSSVLLALSISTFTVRFRKVSTSSASSGWLASLGVNAFFAFLSFIAAALAVLFAGIRLPSLSLVSSIVSGLAFLLAIGLSKATSELVEESLERIEFKSDHLNWRDELLAASSSTPSEELGKEIDALSELVRYSSRDQAGPKTAENELIAASIVQLQAFAGAGDLEAGKTLIETIKKQIATREVKLTSARRKA